MTATVELCRHLCLDSAGTMGPSEEVTQAVAVGDANAAQLEVVMFALTATTVTFTLQESNSPLEGWKDKDAGLTVSDIGRSLLAAKTSVAVGYVRIKCEVTAGTGKAIFAATLHLSSQ